MVLIRYLIWSSIGIALFYLIDILLLRRSNMLKLQRWYYLIAILISLTLPILSTHITPVQDVFERMMLPNFTITYTPPGTIENEVVAMEATEPITSTMWTLEWWENTILIIWVSGICILGLRLAIGWITLRRLLKGAEKRKQGDATLYLVDKKVAPFTYRKSIVINRAMAHDAIMNSILCHELEHVRQKHYRDLTLGVLLQLLQWWNPFAWSLLHNQRNTLEYLADEGVLSSGLDKKSYQLHLLQGVTGLSLELPLLSFSVQNLKKRILTMNSQKKEKKWAGIMCALTSIPVAALLLFSTQLVNAKPASDILLDSEKNNTEMISESVNTLSSASDLQKPTREDPPKKEDGEIFEYATEMPEFPGGTTELMHWLNENIKYPAEAVEKRIEGRVMVSFIIEKDGSVSNPKVVRSVHELLDQEALRVVGLMPKWKPGKDKGKLVRCRYALPITFELPPEQSDSKDNKKSDDNWKTAKHEMNNYIAANINIPNELKDLEGDVSYSVTINKKGELTDCKIMQGLNPTIDKEVLRLLKKMPKKVLSKWSPKDSSDRNEAKFYTGIHFPY